MDPKRWQAASKAVTVLEIVTLWTQYRKTHTPSVLVMAKPGAKNDLIMATVASTEENHEGQIATLLQQEFVPLGCVGAPNEHHPPTGEHLCLTPTRWFEEGSFAQDALGNLSEHFQEIFPDYKAPQEPTAMSWFLSPEAEQKLVEMARQAIASPQPKSVKQVLRYLKRWEKEKKAVRHHGDAEEAAKYRAMGWRGFYLVSGELAQSMSDGLRTRNLKLELEDPERKHRIN